MYVHRRKSYTRMECTGNTLRNTHTGCAYSTDDSVRAYYLQRYYIEGAGSLKWTLEGLHFTNGPR